LVLGALRWLIFNFKLKSLQGFKAGQQARHKQQQYDALVQLPAAPACARLDVVLGFAFHLVQLQHTRQHATRVAHTQGVAAAADEFCSCCVITSQATLATTLPVQATLKQNLSQQGRWQRVPVPNCQ
jgi:hypothetical protein